MDKKQKVNLIFLLFWIKSKTDGIISTKKSETLLIIPTNPSPTSLKSSVFFSIGSTTSTFGFFIINTLSEKDYKSAFYFLEKHYNHVFLLLK